MQVAASFDEYSIDLDLAYDGRMMEFSTVRPSQQELIEDDAAFLRAVRVYHPPARRPDQSDEQRRGVQSETALRSLRDNKKRVAG